MVKSIENLHKFLDLMSHAGFITDSSGIIQYANLAALRYFNPRFQELIGHTSDLLFIGENQQMHRNFIERITSEKGDHSNYSSVILKAGGPCGEEINFEVSATLYEQENAVYVIEMMRPLAEEIMRDQGEDDRLLLALEASREAVWDYDMINNTVWHNSTCNRLFGFLNGTHNAWSQWVENIDERDRPRVVESIEKALHNGALRWEAEYRYQTPHGWISLFDRALIIRNSDGKPIRMIGCGLDLSAQKKVESQLTESEAKFRELANAMPQIVWATDAHGKFEYVNDKWHELTGIAKHERWDRRTFKKAIHPQEYRQTLRAWQTALRQRQAFQIQCRFFDSGANCYKWHLLRALPIISNSEIIRWIGTITDIHEQKVTEKKLVDLTQDLEMRVLERTQMLEVRATQLRFLANRLADAEEREKHRLAELLHDHLQQLLVATKMNMNLAKRRDSDFETHMEQAVKCLDEAIDSSRSLSAELKPPVLYESGLIPALRVLAAKMQSQHQLKVNIVINATFEPVAPSNKSLLYHFTRELLFNTSKHSGTAECTLTVATQKRGVFMITVSDNGRGFDPNALARNEHFGLSNIRERLKILEGKLKVESALGQGTRMTMLIPLKREDRQRLQPISFECAPQSGGTEPPEPELFLRPIRIIVADDHQIVRQGITMLLNDNSAFEIVDEASDGLEAVEKVILQKPNVVLMDINMPKMNGIEATRAIKKQRPETVIIGLSLHDDPEVENSMKNAGANAYLNKGKDLNNLIETIKASM